MTEPGIPNLFISYAREDIEHAKALYGYLKPLILSKNLNVFFDTESIEKGTSWVNEIERQLQDADAFLFLISRHYFESDFVVGKELPLMVRRYRDENKRCWPFCLSNYPWEDFEIEGIRLADIQALGPFDQHEQLTPLNSLSQHEQEAEFRRVYEEIRAWINTLGKEELRQLDNNKKLNLQDIIKPEVSVLHSKEVDIVDSPKTSRSAVDQRKQSKNITDSKIVNKIFSVRKSDVYSPQLISIKYISLGLAILAIILGYILFNDKIDGYFRSINSGPLQINHGGTADSIFIKGISDQYKPGMILPYGEYEVIYNNYNPNTQVKNILIKNSNDSCDKLSYESFPLSFSTLINHTGDNINLHDSELMLVNHSRKYITLSMKPKDITTIFIDNINYACSGTNFMYLYTNNKPLNFSDSSAKAEDYLETVRNYFRYGVGYMDHALYVGYCHNSTNNLDELVFETGYNSEYRYNIKRLVYAEKQNSDHEFLLERIGLSVDVDTLMDCDETETCICRWPEKKQKVASLFSTLNDTISNKSDILQILSKFLINNRYDFKNTLQINIIDLSETPSTESVMFGITSAFQENTLLFRHKYTDNSTSYFGDLSSKYLFTNSTSYLDNKNNKIRNNLINVLFPSPSRKFSSSDLNALFKFYYAEYKNNHLLIDTKYYSYIFDLKHKKKFQIDKMHEPYDAVYEPSDILTKYLELNNN